MKIALVLKQLDGAISEFQLLPLGKIDLDGEEPVILDPEGVAAIIAHFEGRGNDMVIDYEHQTIEGTEAPAAGWIKKLADKGEEGLWATVEWTKRAVEYLKNREYRYFSPVFWYDKATRRVVQIENVALTNYPRINNLKPIMAKMSREEARDAQKRRSEKYGIGVKEGGHVTKPSEWDDVPDGEWLDPVNYRYPCPDADQTRAAASYWGRKENQAQYTPEERSTIEERLDKFRKKFNIGEHKKEEAKMIEKLKKLFGLADDAGEDKVVEAAKTALDKNKELEAKGSVVACKEVLEALGAGDKDGKEQVVAKVKELKDGAGKKTDIEQELVALKKDHGDLKKKLAEKDAEELVNKALSKGQISPAQADDWGRKLATEEPESFKKLILSRREFSEVPMKELPPEGDTTGGGTPAERMERLIAKKMKENDKLTYGEAMDLVAGENPELAEEYIQGGRKKE